MSENKMEQLRERLGEVADVHAAIALLSWDQETYMPPKAAEDRGQHLATLSGLAHRLFVAPEMGVLLDGAAPTDEGDTKLIEVTRYDYDRATRLPEAFVREFAEEQSKAYHAWTKAREEARFDLFAPNLHKMVALCQRKAELLRYEDSPYDALLDEFERGMTAEELRRIFGELRPRLTALVEAIGGAPQPDVAWLEQTWDEDAQWAFGLQVLEDMGYDFEAGRQDRSVHPFTVAFGLNDVRITTRSSARDLFSGLMGSIHEGGHALYGQGHDPADRRTPLLEGASLGIHESQSRMWENVIGRSLPFWKHYAPVFREHFPGQAESVTPEQFYAAVNRVRPSLIRVEADECTYSLHIILRFEIEVDLIEGKLDVADVPDAWNAKMKDYLGVDVPDDAQGCLQDIHWSHGALGYFPTYALGNLYAAQLFEAMQRAVPDVWEQVERAEFAPILAWLREHVHRHGRRKLPVEIVRAATGAEPSAEPFLRYLEGKYRGLYDL